MNVPLKVPPLIVGLVKVLFVSVSVVALPTNVSVDVGSVSVPGVTNLFNDWLVSVLFVSVCDPVNVATVESMAKVMVSPDTAEVKPVPPVI